ncbi:cyclin-like protein [Cokeromyces recurvatus]|uniref:cyclin-like protein n=1 Tax=Cokeromyces recurvatus TaxID=90255 RepID=UPI00221E49FF|nr:cyclin-like protein [Cokeromyces recurvatus]KAI7905419.1 cyclin-like protein [Cokeromyces recurvatus]
MNIKLTNIGSLKANSNSFTNSKLTYDRSILSTKSINANPFSKKNEEMKMKEFREKFSFNPNRLKEKEDDTRNQSKEEEVKTKEVASIINNFFEDNKTRYARNEDEDEDDPMIIVPVLPITVPRSMRHMFLNENNNNTSFASNTNTNKVDTTADSSTTFSYKHNLGPLSNEKRKEMLNSSFSHFRNRDSFSNSSIFAPNAPPLAYTVNEETIRYEADEEDRAKLAMLQTTQIWSRTNWNDPMLVVEYASDIYGYFYDTEISKDIDPNYADEQQTEVTWKMRGVLIDWVIEIHYLFGLLPETLYLAVNIIDRFLSQRTVALGKLQLVGVTSLYIAAKFEETFCPSLQDFLFITDFAVSKENVLKAERYILEVLGYQLCFPNPMNFLRRLYTEDEHCDVNTRTLAKYFLEVGCVNHTLLSIRPSKLAAASLWLAKKMLSKGKWTSNLTKISGYSPEETRPVVENLLHYLSQPVMHDAFFRKWSAKRYSKASIFVRDWVNRYYVIQ